MGNVSVIRPRGNNHFNETPRALRLISKDRTMGDVERATGISRSGLSRIFNGQRNPSVHNARRIAQYLNVTVDDLLAAVQEASASEFTKAA